MTTSIVPFNPADAVQLAIAMKHVVMAVSSEVLKENIDYGKIPGTDKNVLLKPGAERLCTAFKLSPLFEAVSQVEDFEKGFFFYRYSCALIHRETGEVYGRGIGSCNSQENKYGWRWVSAPPSHLDPSTLMTRTGALREPKFAIDKGETGGKYGKPAEYWQAFRDAIANNTARKVPDQKTKDGRPMDVYEIGGLEYRIPNPDVFDLVNTIDKMAQKRALIAATLIATNASEFFTQDMEDFAPDTARFAPTPQVIEGQFEEVSPAPKSAPLSMSRTAPASAAVPPSPQTNAKVPPSWWGACHEKYQLKHGKDGLQMFSDTARELLASGALASDTPASTAYDRIMKDVEDAQNAALVNEADGFPKSWGRIVKEIAPKSFNGDTEEAKAFIRACLAEGLVTPNMSVVNATSNLVGRIVKIEAEKAMAARQAEAAAAAPVQTPRVEDPADPFADLMTN